MKNPKVGDRVVGKRGMKDSGVITAVYAGLVDVEWRFQDETHVSRCVLPQALRRVRGGTAARRVCPCCHRPLE